jgi:SOS-response transcriptional repressor LexA
LIEHRTGVARRDAIISYISEYSEERGFAPSVTEIAAHVGTVRSNIHHHLVVLRDEGRLTFHPGIARSWVVSQPH